MFDTILSVVKSASPQLQPRVSARFELVCSLTVLLCGRSSLVYPASFSHNVSVWTNSKITLKRMIYTVIGRLGQRFCRTSALCKFVYCKYVGVWSDIHERCGATSNVYVSLRVDSNFAKFSVPCYSGYFRAAWKCAELIIKKHKHLFSRYYRKIRKLPLYLIYWKSIINWHF